MPIDQRRFLALAATTALACNFKARAAETQPALFWRVTIGSSSAILYGYERVAASVVPDVVKDGDRFIDETKSLILDLSPVVKFPAIEIDRKITVPLSNTISKQTLTDLRDAFGKTPQVASMTDLLSGLEITSLLMGEGQTPSPATAGGVIAQHGRALDRPVALLISDAEAQGLWNPPDIAALNRSIDEDKVRYLLDLRKQVGPIGAHLEKLYLARQSEEINRFTADIRQHGIVSPSSFLSEERMRALLLDRLVAALAAQDAVAAFALLPLGLLTGADGLVAKLRAGGHAVTVLA